MTRTRMEPELEKRLQRSNWKSIWNEPHTESQAKVSSYLWKLNAFNTYGPTGIPICPKCSTREHILHIMWDCATAAMTWKWIISAWGITCNTKEDLKHYKYNILADQPPLTTSELRNQLTQTNCNIHQVHQVLNEYWKLLMRLGRSKLWKWRNNRIWKQTDTNIFEQKHEISPSCRSYSIN